MFFSLSSLLLLAPTNNNNNCNCLFAKSRPYFMWEPVRKESPKYLSLLTVPYTYFKQVKSDFEDTHQTHGRIFHLGTDNLDLKAFSGLPLMKC